MKVVVPLKKKSKLGFDETVKLVEIAAVEEGFSHIATKSMDAIFAEKLGITDYPRYTIILACHPKYAKAALDVSKDMGMLFPCSFTVFEEDGEVWIGHTSIMKMGPEVGLAPADDMMPVIECTGEGVTKVWGKL